MGVVLRSAQGGNGLSEKLTDAETLAMAAKAVRPAVLAAIRQRISEKLTALDLCLLQQEQLLEASRDPATKARMASMIEVTRALCLKIQQDLNGRIDDGDCDSGDNNTAA